MVFDEGLDRDSGIEWFMITMALRFRLLVLGFYGLRTLWLLWSAVGIVNERFVLTKARRRKTNTFWYEPRPKIEQE